MKLYYKTRSCSILIFIITIALQSVFVLMSQNVIGAVVMVALTLVVFISLLFKNNISRIFKFNKYKTRVLQFGLYCVFTSLWAVDSTAATTKGITIIEILICMSVFYAYYDNEDNIDNLLLTIVWTGAIISIFCVKIYGLDMIMASAVAGERFVTEFANINSVAMKGALGFVVALYFAFFKKNIFPLLLSSLSLVIILASGSKKAFIILLFGTITLIFLRSKSSNKLLLILKYFTIFIGFVFVVNLLNQLPIFSTISNRMEGLIAYLTGTGVVDASTSTRDLFIQEGLDQWYKTPIWGIGMGNSYLFNSEGTYTHCNYVELLSSGGIIGLILYYSLYLYPIIQLIKYRNIDKYRASLFLLIIGILLLTDYGIVTYYLKYSYFYLMVIYIYVNTLKKKVRINNEQNYTTNR